MFAAVLAPTGAPGMLNDAARTTLIALVQQHGHDFTDNPWRVQELLEKELAGFKLERSLLLAASRESVPVHLRLADETSVTSVKARLIKRLVDEHGLHESAARWSVEVWAEALGVTASEAHAPPAREEPKPIDDVVKKPRPKASGLRRALSIVVVIAVAVISAEVPLLGLGIAAVCFLAMGIMKVTKRMRSRRGL
jgi:hypothetical protein